MLFMENVMLKLNIKSPLKLFIIPLCLLYFQAGHCLAEPRLVHSIDFSKPAEGDARPWLAKKGYIQELDADEIEVNFRNNQLNLTTSGEKSGIFALQLAEKNYLNNITRIEIEWGVSRQPTGANWEEGNNRVPIALMFFFGTDKISSGLPFGLNAAPYFLSPFIGRKETLGKTYTGKLYKEGGRYLCVAVSEGSAEVIKSTIKVNPRFMKLFKQADVPPLTGIAFQMNTTDTEGGASAFIRKLEFYAD
ncbi:MAG: hypothetical protein GQ582_03235 [Methyloprofundus sp.]|nr:hypothetical protein [Methyloprofundus sp.]